MYVEAFVKQNRSGVNAKSFGNRLMGEKEKR